jgi:hypothetical protein
VALWARLGANGVFRDGQGRAVAHLVEGKVVVDTEMPGERTREAINDNKRPQLCPKPMIDGKSGNESGQGTASRQPGKDYEDRVKAKINPGNPTPRGKGYVLPDLSRNLATVVFDDCQHQTGMMVEAKGPNYGPKLTGRAGASMRKRFELRILDQARRQVQAAGPRDIEWHFAEKEAADATRKLFRSDGERSLDHIRVVFDYWREGMK